VTCISTRNTLVQGVYLQVLSVAARSKQTDTTNGLTTSSGVVLVPRQSQLKPNADNLLEKRARCLQRVHFGLTVHQAAFSTGTTKFNSTRPCLAGQVQTIPQFAKGASDVVVPMIARLTSVVAANIQLDTANHGKLATKLASGISPVVVLQHLQSALTELP